MNKKILVCIFIVIIVLAIVINIIIGIYSSKKNGVLQFMVEDIYIEDMDSSYKYSLEHNGIFAGDYTLKPQKKFKAEEVEKILNNPDRYKVLVIDYKILNPSTDVSFNDIFFSPDFDKALSERVLDYTSFYAYDKLNWSIQPNQTHTFRQHFLIDLKTMSKYEF